tara:strand:+ start:1579 stop:1839 length:261 start_codon:yes stop_codon:yes gene_type:complete
MTAKPRAIIFEYNWGDNKIDANGNVIPDSDVTYFVCEPIWIEDEDPTEVDGIVIDQSDWEADLDNVIAEFNTEKEAQQFLVKIGGK